MAHQDYKVEKILISKTISIFKVKMLDISHSVVVNSYYHLH